MNKNIVFLLILAVSYSVHGQFDDDSLVYTRYIGHGYIANGGAFTPKGDLRVLVVFISYGEPYDSQEVEGWPASSAFPNWATDVTNKPFYSSYSEFSNNFFSDNNRNSISNFYYQMSNGQFRLIADYYPRRVVVDNVSSTDDWGGE